MITILKDGEPVDRVATREDAVAAVEDDAVKVWEALVDPNQTASGQGYQGVCWLGNIGWLGLEPLAKSGVEYQLVEGGHHGQFC